MGPEQFTKWVAYFRLEPVGFEKLFAVLSLVGSAASGAYHGHCIEPHNFTPWVERPGQSPEEMMAVCGAIAARHNARVT